MLICGAYLGEKGFGYGHDSNFALVEDGEVKLHVELERHFDAKHISTSLPEFIDVLKQYVSLSDIDLFALNFRAARNERRVNPRYTEQGWHSKVISRKWRLLGDVLARKPYVGIRHHIGHLAAAYYASNWDRAIGISYDGGGDCGDYFAVGYFEDGKMKHYQQIPNLNVGGFFTHCGRLVKEMGKADLSVAGKVMALGSFGKPGAWKQQIKEHLLSTDATDVEKFGVTGSDRDLQMQSFLRDLELAVLDIVLEQTRGLMKQFDCKNLLLGGGCALNININHHVVEETGCDLFIHPATSDGGLGVGFAQFAHFHVKGAPHKPMAFHPFSGLPLKGSLPADVASQYRVVKDLPGILKVVRDLLFQGKAVGIAQGRSEVGPRALGHRSIIAASHLPGMQLFLNTRIKTREWYRPIAPVALARNAEKCFVFPEQKKHTMRLMLNNVFVRPPYTEMFQSGVHVDGSARLQIVEEDPNEWFFKVLDYLEKSDGMYGILNTSFNPRGKPLVNDIGECFNLLDHTELAAVIIEDTLYVK